MNVISTSISEVLIIEPKVFGDSRGFFFESFNHKNFSQAAGLEVKFVQDNHSRSVRSVLRGLHYQIGKPQGKLVRVVRGGVFDVAVDIRRSSPTFSQWVGVELTEDNNRQLWIPPGFAHGFYVLSDTADFLYKTTEYYFSDLDRNLLWNDPAIAVSWPIHADAAPIISAKDKIAPKLTEAELFD